MSALGLTGTVVVPVQRLAAGQVGSPPPLAVALLFAFAAPAATVTFKVSVVLPPAAIVPVYVQLNVVVPLQLQFVPVALCSVIPAGSVSATTMFPAVGPAPVFDTVIVYSAGCPTVNGFGVAVFVTVSCGCSNVVVAVPVLFALFGSVVPAGGVAVALLVIDVPLVGALPVIVNVTLPPLGKVVIVLVTVLPATLTVPHAALPVGVPQLTATAVTPAGTASLNVVPFALLGPRLLTTTVYDNAPP
jgi:hypothetical protein